MDPLPPNQSSGDTAPMQRAHNAKRANFANAATDIATFTATTTPTATATTIPTTTNGNGRNNNHNDPNVDPKQHKECRGSEW